MVLKNSKMEHFNSSFAVDWYTVVIDLLLIWKPSLTKALVLVTRGTSSSSVICVDYLESICVTIHIRISILNFSPGPHTVKAFRNGLHKVGFPV